MCNTACSWVSEIITQNVDRLHHKAGSHKVIELHGTTHEVICLQCRRLTPREEMQRWLEDLNPYAAEAIEDLSSVNEEVEEKIRLLRAGTNEPLERNLRERLLGAGRMTPDGDVELPSHRPQQNPDGDVELAHRGFQEEFRVPSCPSCGDGILKPNVVFFGDALPEDRARQAKLVAESAPGILVVGSSLAVWSAFRLVKAAKDNKKPVAVINVGPTRADNIVDLKVEALAGEALSRLAADTTMLIPPTL